MVFAITQNIDLVNESRPGKVAAGGGGDWRPVVQYHLRSIARAARIIVLAGACARKFLLLCVYEWRWRRD